jgi:tripeptide aminopeptidase
MKDDLAAFLDPLLDLTLAIQQIPAPTFHEDERASFIRARFAREGLADIDLDEAGNVYARLPGENPDLPLVISAHLDTVFPGDTDLTASQEPGKITGPGIGDNSLGLAGLFGLVWALRQRQRVLPYDLWLVANTGEEGLGDLRGMKAVVQRFGKQALAYIVLEGMALGHIYVRGLGVRRYQIKVQTEGGHSWVNYGRPSAIHELARLTTQLADLELPSNPRTTLNVGVISGGTSVNTIAADASLELDLRSEEGSALSRLDEQVQALVREANCEQLQAVSVTSKVIGNRPFGEIHPEHPLVRLACRSLEAAGVQPSLSIGSTDANVPLSLGLPAVCLGLTNGGRAHTKDEFIHTEPLLQGLKQCLALVEAAGEILPGKSA